jgi:hypothetical protein
MLKKVQKKKQKKITKTKKTIIKNLKKKKV